MTLTKSLLIVAASLAASTPQLFAGDLVTWGSAQTPPAPGTGIIAISAAVDHSLALKADGTIVAWGYDFNYQCRVPAGLTGVRSVAAGDFFSIAARSNGTVVAWGDNMYGQCDVPALSDAVAVSAGRSHAVALRANGTLVSWGNNNCGQTNVPAGLGPVKAIHAEANYTMALRADGTVAVWGSNDSGQTNVPPGLTNVKSIDGNISYCMALKQDGSIVMWGKGPAAPEWLGTSIAMAAGEDHALSIREDGTVIAWGWNKAGQLNIPNTVQNPTALAASWHFSAALIGGSAPVFFRALEPAMAGGAFKVMVQSQSGFNYWLEYKNALTDGAWTALPAVQGTGGTLTLSDPGAPVSSRLYRVGRN